MTVPFGTVPAVKLREIREGKRITVRTLAKDAGVAEVTIWRLETGRRAGTLDVWRRIADALDVPLADLIADEEGAA